MKHVHKTESFFDGLSSAGEDDFLNQFNDSTHRDLNRFKHFARFNSIDISSRVPSSHLLFSAEGNLVEFGPIDSHDRGGQYRCEPLSLK